MNLGDKIGEIRRKIHLTQEEFAKSLFVSRQTVSNLENSNFIQILKHWFY